MTPNKNTQVNPGFYLKLFDKLSGVFTDLFDPRLLTLSVALLVGYATLFTQRKFPGRWMEFIFIGMLLLVVVTVTARAPDLRRNVRWRRDMVLLWFALHGLMLVSGFVNEDWLPEAVSLLVAYPFVFAVFSARDDEATFSSVLHGPLLAIFPFYVWSYATRPLVLGYPGYYGVFYNANGLAMCSIVFSTCALLLCQARVIQKRYKLALVYGLAFLLGSATLMLTLSRAAWAAYLGVLVVVLGTIALTRSKHKRRMAALMAAVVLLLGAGLTAATLIKLRADREEDYLAAQWEQQYYDFDILEKYDPATRPITLDDLFSDRFSIWTQALTHLTIMGHNTSVIEEWASIDGGDRRLNAHNAFVAMAYNHGWPVGLLFLSYVVLSLWRALQYYRRHRDQVLAVTPLAITVCFIMEGLFESVYAPFSVVGCLYLLVQGVLWRSAPQEERS